MGGLGLSDLPRPPDEFNPALHPEFETRMTCRTEDGANAVLLEHWTRQNAGLFDHVQARRLAEQLAYGDGPEPLDTRASRLAYGDVRMRVGGAIWQLLAESIAAGQEVSFITLCPRGGDCFAERLDDIRPVDWCGRLRVSIDRERKELPLGPGWSIFFLEAQWETVEQLYNFHWHGFAAGVEKDAVNQLRGRRNYVSAGEEEERDLVRTRVRMTRQPLYDLGYLCTYPLKAFWQARLAASNQEGNRKRSRKVRLAGLQQVQSLLWFDRWPIEQISVVRGLRVTRAGLTTNN